MVSSRKFILAVLASALGACCSNAQRSTERGSRPGQDGVSTDPGGPDTPRALEPTDCKVFPEKWAVFDGDAEDPDPSAAQRALDVGLAAAASGDHLTAIEAFNRAVTLDPSLGLAHLAKAESHLFYDNDPMMMKTHLAKAVVLLPENPRAHLRFADYCAEVGEQEAAVTHWQCALELKPTLKEARQSLARHLFEADRHDEAAKHLQQVLQSSPSEVSALLLLADVLHAKGQLLEAAQHVERAAQTVKTSATLFRRAGELYDQGGNGLSARRVRGRADALDPPPEQRKMRPLPVRKRRKRK